LTLHVLNLVKPTIGVIQILVKSSVGAINLLQGSDGVAGLLVVIVGPHGVITIGIGERVQPTKGVVIILGHLTINIAIGNQVTTSAVIDVVLSIALRVGDFEEAASVVIIGYCLYRILSSKIKDKAWPCHPKGLQYTHKGYSASRQASSLFTALLKPSLNCLHTTPKSTAAAVGFLSPQLPSPPRAKATVGIDG
jgi:hypothetical protein